MAIGPYDAALRRHRVWDVYPTKLEMRTSGESRWSNRSSGIIKEQLGARRFLLRGFANVSAEWTLLGTAFNLRTLWRVWRLGVFADLLRSPKPHFAS